MFMKTILLVEPEELLRSFYALELQEDGFRVICARNSQEAAKMLSAKSPDLLIIDLWGWTEQTGEGIEDVMKAAYMPVIINTGYPMSCVNGLLSEKVAYVLKSSNLTKLKEQIPRMMKDTGPFAIEKRRPASLYSVV
jgi:DNA-binding NtrC family response regulator